MRLNWREAAVLATLLGVVVTGVSSTAAQAGPVQDGDDTVLKMTQHETILSQSKHGSSGSDGAASHSPVSLAETPESAISAIFRRYEIRAKSEDLGCLQNQAACGIGTRLGYLFKPFEGAAPNFDGGAEAVIAQDAAYEAVARLHLTPPKPVIGPSPDINEWHMAAVGYPMWLSASGNLTPAKVSDTVYDLTVSLTPHLVDITYKMGDGHTLTCTDNTHPWVMGTTPGAPSPTCGYTYTQPSLPHGSYTITATTHWAIDWAVNGEGGTIPLYENATTTLPVGELQVLIR